MDLALVVILLLVVLFFFRDIKWVTYLLGTIELFLRLLHWFGDHIGLPELNNVIDLYLPTSLFSLIGKYTNGLIYELLCWVLFGFLFFWLIYLVKYFFGKK